MQFRLCNSGQHCTQGSHRTHHNSQIHHKQDGTQSTMKKKADAGSGYRRGDAYARTAPTARRVYAFSNCTQQRVDGGVHHSTAPWLRHRSHHEAGVRRAQLLSVAPRVDKYTRVARAPQRHGHPGGDARARGSPRLSGSACSAQPPRSHPPLSRPNLQSL